MTVCRVSGSRYVSTYIVGQGCRQLNGYENKYRKMGDYNKHWTRDPRTRDPRTQGPEDQGSKDHRPNDLGPNDQGANDLAQH